MAVTFQDPTDQFFDTTQTMAFQRGQTVFHRIVLQEEDPPVTFDSSQELRVPLGHAGDSMAQLELPADNLLHKDGKPFKGEFRNACFQSKGFSKVPKVHDDHCILPFLSKQNYWQLNLTGRKIKTKCTRGVRLQKVLPKYFSFLLLWTCALLGSMCFSDLLSLLL